MRNKAFLYLSKTFRSLYSWETHYNYSFFLLSGIGHRYLFVILLSLGDILLERLLSCNRSVVIGILGTVDCLLSLTIAQGSNPTRGM